MSKTISLHGHRIRLGAIGGFCLFGLFLLTVGMITTASQAQTLRTPLVPPQVLVQNPLPNSNNIHPASTLSITFDQAIDPATVSTRTFAVHAMQTGWLTETLAVQSDTILLTPTRPLMPGELIQVSVTTDTQNMGGEPPISSTVWQFRVAAGIGSAVYTDTGQRLTNDESRYGDLGDIDGDGDLDAYIANINGADRVWINDGTGTFSISQNLGISASTGIALGDLDGDGDLDAFVDTGGFAANKVWLNDGGTFTDSGQNLGNLDSIGVALGDVDGDGDLDAFVANGAFNASPNKVWLNQGDGTFLDSGQNLANAYSVDVKLGDLDGDSDLDAFVTNLNYGLGQANRIWVNDGHGIFSTGQALGFAESVGVDLGDLDGDGDLDAFVSNGYSSSQADRVWINDGTGSFTAGQSVGNLTSFGTALGDIDGDGDLDAYVSNGNSTDDGVWLNDGDGTFTLQAPSAGSHSLYAILGDLDGDGDLDSFLTKSLGTLSGLPDEVWINLDPASGMSVRGPDYGLQNVDHTFEASIWPTTVLPPASFVWQTDGEDPVAHTGNLTDTATFSWDSLGEKTLLVTATNAFNIFTTTHTITVTAWQTSTSIPAVVSSYGFAQCAGNLDHFYVIGGADDFSSPLDEVWWYEAGSDLWTPLAPLPQALLGPATTCYEGAIYVAGGGTELAISNLFYIYDIAGDEWTSGPTLPRNVFIAGLGAWGGKLYLAGGSPFGSPWSPVDVVDVYDIESGSWAAAAGSSLPTPTSSPGWTQAGPYLYLVGGYTGSFSNNVAATQRYNMATDAWETGPPFTSSRANFALAATESRLYALGGDLPGGTGVDETNLVEILDLAAWPVGGWATLSEGLPQALLGNSAG